MKRILFLLILFFCSASDALVSGGANWDGLHIYYKQNEKFTYYLQLENRLFYAPETFDLFLIRPAIAYSVTQNLSLWLGYDQFLSARAAARTKNVWEQMQYCFYCHAGVELTSRTRVEQRYNNQFPGEANRLRERLSARFTVSDHQRLHPLFFEELFFNLNHPLWVSEDAFSQNRAFLGLEFSINKPAALLIGYLNQSLFRPRVTTMRHILYAAFEFRF